MITSISESSKSYNERLFDGGIRGALHNGRYRWVERELRKLDIDYSSVFELGCYDGKLIKWLPNPAIRYLGVDANWDDGLEIARKTYGHINQDYRFIESASIDSLPSKVDEFDLSFCMETLEHIAPAAVDSYLERMALVTKQYAFITVPNEIGIVFLLKTIAKAAIGCSRSYTPAELYNHAMGRTHKVTLPNGKGGHKGFGYHELIEQVSQYFEIHKACGNPFGVLPPYLNFGVGIIAKPLKRKA